MSWRDRKLMRGIAQGNAAACERFVRMYYKPIYRFLAHMCHHEHLAEDLTQETFATAWVAIGRFDASSSLSTWLYRIARNKFLDHYRRERRFAKIPAYELMKRDNDGQDPLYHLLVDEQTRRLADAIAILDSANREIVVLHYCQGLSYREMAQVLEEPVGTVKWRTNEAMKQLKTLLESIAEHDSQR